MKRLWVPVFAGMTLISILAATAWAIVAAPGDVVPLRLQITSAGAGITGLKPKLTIIRQDGTVFRAATTMIPADGQAGVYGGSFTCPAGTGHYTAYENTTGMYADSETEEIDVEPAASYAQQFANLSGAVARVPANVWLNGQRTLTAAFSNPTSINAYLAGIHGAGAWGAGAITILPFQGAASYETVAQGNDVHVTYGDSVSIPYSINKDITGDTVWFGAKSLPTDTTYAIAPRDITGGVSSAVTGTGFINLSTADTKLLTRKYAAQMEIRNGSQVNTVLKFNLFIDPSILNQ